jgi:hypothetical protein
MTLTTFDTLKYANTLKAAGVPEKQAEAEASALADALAVNLKDLVTKDDLRSTEQRLDAKIDLLKWMVGVLIALTSAVLVRLLFFPIR